MSDIGLPKIDITFKGLGASAIRRGSKGVAVLIIKDDTNTTFTFAEYTSIADLTSEEQSKYTPENVQYIKDVLEGTPSKLIIARMNPTGTLADLLSELKGKIPMNCWISIADATQQETDDLVSFVKSAVANDNKRYKALVYKATTSDDMHIVNFTNSKVKFKDVRGEQTGDKAVPYLLGYLAGLSLDMSSIAKVLDKFESVIEPDNLEAAVNNGEFVLYNDEGEVMVARGVNSLVTTGQDITDDMKFILIVEVMDLIYSDIFTTWKKFYKGKYKNYLDNQMLLIGAINSYFSELEKSLLLDPEFDNLVSVDIEAQREANIPKYGADVVATWDDNKVMQMTVGTNVFLSGNIKILNAMEDIQFNIYM
ncbi:phage tail sheath C-terminal domain-containing protein [Caminicella sporogenes]|uniref:phage tail sheath C-terminal domain-containing protein n=1 Tax=Caminicella sporogenes TaxID=166485 RepID=UPI002540C1A8|nr:phage tail sheath C-terminal domain-containing protein [Caminicella sporogenes]WIF95123.1 phage tail sheath C-terminal domain-containing protein [Caminicella sporogenes]